MYGEVVDWHTGVEWLEEIPWELVMEIAPQMRADTELGITGIFRAHCMREGHTVWARMCWGKRIR